MHRLTEAIERRCDGEEVGATVRWLSERAEDAARSVKEWALQGVIDRAVTRYLGRRRGRDWRRVLSPWPCPRCGPRLGSELRRNGHYRRQPLTTEGVITLRIPQLVCRGCDKSVPFRHPLLPRRKRLWLDLDQQVLLLYLEGCSYRAAKRLIERHCRSAVGLMTIWRSLQTTARGRHAPAGRLPARYLGLDEVYHKVRGERRWFLSLRAQDALGGQHWIGSVLSSDRNQEAWETALVELGISRYNPPFAVISDGDQAIESAVAMTLPGVRQQRCTWHLKHNAAEWIGERYRRAEHAGQRAGLMAAVHVIVDAPDLEQRAHSLRRPGTGLPLAREGTRRCPRPDPSQRR